MWKLINLFKYCFKNNNNYIDDYKYLYESCKKEDYSTINYLINTKKININKKIRNTTALHIACELKNYVLIKFLLENLANPNVKINFSYTPLHILCKKLWYNDTINYSEYINSIIYILYKYGANLNSQDFNGQTALHFACSHGKLKIIRRLITLGADINIPDKFGVYPLDILLDIKIEKLIPFLDDYDLIRSSSKKINGYTQIIYFSKYNNRIIYISKIMTLETIFESYSI